MFLEIVFFRRLNCMRSYYFLINTILTVESNFVRLYNKLCHFAGIGNFEFMFITFVRIVII